MPAGGVPTLFYRHLINLARLGGGRFHIRGAERKKIALAGMVNQRGEILLRFTGGRETIATQEQSLSPVTRVGLGKIFLQLVFSECSGNAAGVISPVDLTRPNLRANLLRCCVDAGFIARRPNEKTFGARRQSFSLLENRGSQSAV